ncbi:MAG TPA: SRPBCC family protein [Vicinamibacteria bacterium]|nr:SRPBCC family protein [Vicinamibacteria bacterium]
MADQTTKSIIVGAGVVDVFEAWSNFENFPHFMKHIKSVTKRPDGSTHWVAHGPLGKSVEWDADTTMFEPNTRIAWRSRDDSPITTSGQVTFVELGTGQTQVNVTMQWSVPSSKGGDKLAELVASPEKRLEEDLYRFKTYVEGRKVSA